jgi:hypothetical protein
MPDKQRLLELALKGLEAERTTIDGEIIEIRSQLSGSATANTAKAVSATAAQPKRKRMSAAAKRRISEGMKRRYAELRKAGQPTGAGPVSPKQSSGKKQNGGSRLTAAGRKKLSDLMKKRWADKAKAKTK